MAIYTAVFGPLDVAVAQDLFEITSPTDAITIIHGVELSQSTELGDAAEELLTISLRRGNTTAGNGTLLAPATTGPHPIESGSSAYGGAVRINSATKASAGTPQVLRVDNWNVRMSYLWLPTPEMRPIMGPSVRVAVELVNAPADAIRMSGTLWFEELGG
jgi:hypothetical protein